MSLKVSVMYFLTCLHYSYLGFASPTSTGLCPLGQHFVKAHHRNSYFRTDGTFVSSSYVAAHCKPSPPSFTQWNARLLDTPSKTWLKRAEKKRKWKVDEKERVLESLSDLPIALLIDSVNAIYRLEKSSLFHLNPAAGESGEIALYDLAFNSKTNLTRVLAHEFAHELYRRFSDAEKDQYRVAAEWLLIKNPQSIGGYLLIPARDDSHFVETDGPESMTEDFSNNIEYFLFEPDVLLKRTPRVHAWIRKKFGDSFRLGRGRK